MICSERTCHPVSIADLQAKDQADSWFHAAAYVVLLLGIWRLFQAGKRRDVFWSGRFFVGAILLGIGLFNVIEGVIDHHLLQIHHVRFGPDRMVWDLGFLLVSAGIAMVGWLLTRSHGPAETPSTSIRKTQRHYESALFPQ